jgi:hypothetical protein
MSVSRYMSDSMFLSFHQLIIHFQLFRIYKFYLRPSQSKPSKPPHVSGKQPRVPIFGTKLGKMPLTIVILGFPRRSRISQLQPAIAFGEKLSAVINLQSAAKRP